MLIEYKNYIFNALKNSGLDLDKFESVYFDEKNAFRIIHAESNYVFDIFFKYDSYEVADFRYNKFAPKEKFEMWDKTPIRVNLNNFLQSWIGNIKNYQKNLDAIDEWEMYKNGKSILDFSNKNNKDYFSESDLKTIEEKLNTFKNYILDTFKPSVENTKFVEEKIIYLVESSKRNTVYDWQNIVTTILLNIASTLLLDHEKSLSLFNYFKNLFIAILYLAN